MKISVFTPKGERILFDLIDLPLFNSKPRFIGNHGYVSFNVWQGRDKTPKAKRTLFHREILKCGPTQVVDHINGDRLDNRRSNLRICSQKQNSRNQKTRLERPYKGVCSSGKKENPWRSYICYDGKYKALGHYKTKEEAAKAYDAEAIKLDPEFSRTNFKNEKS